MSRLTSLKLAVVGFVLLMMLAVTGVQAREWVTETAQTTIHMTQLPRQGVEMYQLILQGGPFVHEKDGVVFANRERLLPRAPRGHYHEYTVRTPGVSHRGTRRIVCAGLSRAPDACYYTADHYASFRRIVP